MHIEAKLKAEGDADIQLTKISNLSVSGASIFVSKVPRVGSKLDIEFAINEDELVRAISCQATVMWIDDIAENKRAEIGVSFDALADAEKQGIARYIRNLLLG